MRILIGFVASFLFVVAGYGDEVQWNKQTLLPEFVSEGASVADFDGDGNVDLASGPYWWRGPEFSERFEYREGKPFDPQGYSDHFFSFTADIDGDGDADLISVGFPGKEATAYLNPGKPTENNRWPAHVIADQISNESPTLVDLIQGGLPELVCSRDGAFGYYQAYGGGGAQILVHDVDGDGLNDIITSLNAHGYGLAWFAQKKVDNHEPRFIRHDVLGNTSSANPYGVVFSQLHALQLVDVDGDGFQDIVTGKRYWAHGGKDPGGGDAPVLYWFSGARQANGDVLFQPFFVDDQSGVGTEVVVTDMNGDDRVDIVSSNKRGVAIHFQRRHKSGD